MDLAKTNMAGVADSLDWTCDGAWPDPDADGVLYQSSETGAEEVEDGLSHTLFVGEMIGAGPGTNLGYFWATWNILHTANGINLTVRVPPRGPWSVPDTGFASYHPSGCHFTLGDGSVRFISESIDQYVLAAMTTRAGGEVFDQNN
jgi:hypothetical protein